MNLAHAILPAQAFAQSTDTGAMPGNTTGANGAAGTTGTTGTTDTPTNTMSTQVPDGSALNTDTGTGYVALWGVGILIVAAFLIWVAMRSRKNPASRSTNTSNPSTTRPATNPRL